jgi:hypothetical protein
VAAVVLALILLGLMVGTLVRKRRKMRHPNPVDDISTRMAEPTLPIYQCSDSAGDSAVDSDADTSWFADEFFTGASPG